MSNAHHILQVFRKPEPDKPHRKYLKQRKNSAALDIVAIEGDDSRSELQEQGS
jgi:hypothetical protein